MRPKALRGGLNRDFSTMRDEALDELCKPGELRADSAPENTAQLERVGVLRTEPT